MCESFLFSSCVSFFVSRGGGRREKKARSRSRAMMKKRALFVHTEIVPTASAERSRKTKTSQCLSELAHFFSFLFFSFLYRTRFEREKEEGGCSSVSRRRARMMKRDCIRTLSEGKNVEQISLSSSVARSRNFSSFVRLEFALCTRCLTFLEQEKELLFEVSLPCLQVKHAVEEKKPQDEKSTKNSQTFSTCNRRT